MRKFALVTLALLVSSFVWGQDSPGMYVDQAGSLAKMEHVPFSGTGTRGVAKTILVPGAGWSGVWEFSGAQAPIRVSARPRFVYQLQPSQAISERDIVMVRMDQKSDHREIRVSKMNGWTLRTRGGFDKKKLVAIVCTRKGDTLEISPAADLDAGEYFVTSGFTPLGFDFGVAR